MNDGIARITPPSNSQSMCPFHSLLHDLVWLHVGLGRLNRLARFQNNGAVQDRGLYPRSPPAEEEGGRLRFLAGSGLWCNRVHQVDGAALKLIHRVSAKPLTA